MYHSKPLSKVASPATTKELFDWVRGADSCDPMLETTLMAATTQVIEYLQLELMPRTRLATWHTWPTVGTRTPGISNSEARYKTTLELPYSNLISVDGVEIFGEAFTDFEIFTSQRPGLIDLQSSPWFTYDCDDDAIQVQYLAGFGDGAEDVPEDIKIAILMAAGHLYHKRGACDIKSMLDDSGAKALIQHHKPCPVVF